MAPSFQDKARPKATSTPSFAAKARPKVQAPAAAPRQPWITSRAPDFPASTDGSIAPNVAKTFGNIPSSARNLGRDLISPVNPLDLNAPLNIGNNIVKSAGAASDIFKDKGFIGGLKSIAGGFVDTAKKGVDFVKGVIKEPGNAVEAVAKAGIEDPLLIPSALIAPKGAGVARDLVSDAAKPVTRGADTSLNSVIVKPVRNAAQSVRSSVGDIEKHTARQVDQLLSQTRGIQNKANLAERKGTNVRPTLSEPIVFRGIKVQNGAIVPDEAISVLDNRIDSLMSAKSQLLPVLDRELPPVTRDQIRERAIADVAGKSLPADEADIIAAINKQVDALPETMSYTDLDKLRARSRTSARDAKGIQKRDSEYTALENATRDLGFDASDNLPFDVNGEYRTLNNDIKQLITTKEFLDQTLRGQKVKGGRLGTITGRIIGGMTGSQFGWLGALVGQEAGATIAKVLTNNQLGSSIKMQLIRGLTDNPEVIKRSEDLLRRAQGYAQPQLPAPPPGAPRSQIFGTDIIPLPERGETNVRTTLPKTIR